MLRALSQLLWLAVAADASRTSVGAELTEARRDVATMLERVLCLAVLLFMIVVKRLFAPSSDALGHACPSPQERFAPSGLKWRNIGETAPVDGSEFANPELASALVSGQTQFTESEWDSFGIASLCNGHYLKAGDSYFKPAERCLCGSGLIFDECHNPDVGCRRIMKLKRNKVQAAHPEHGSKNTASHRLQKPDALQEADALLTPCHKIPPRARLAAVTSCSLPPRPAPPVENSRAVEGLMIRL